VSAPSSGPVEDQALHVMAILDHTPTMELIQRTLALSKDQLAVATDLAEGLARASVEVPDVVLVDVALGQNAGLAVVHHLRAIAPDVLIYALARSGKLELGTQAVALGGTGVLMLPLSGDELLTVLTDVRTRRAERALRMRLEREAEVTRRLAAIGTKVADIAEAPSRREAAQALARLLVEEAGAITALVYLPAGEGQRQLMRAAVVGPAQGTPAFCEDIELLAYADASQLQVVRLSLRREYEGLLLIGGLPAGKGSEPLPLINLIASQAATALALLGEREQSNRGAIKDPSSSAYTFSYFVDVAGREIDKARRYDRRFALATISIEDEGRTGGGVGRPSREPGVEAAERVLGVVRDTDVLARVDDREFYLLMPETGGKGAHTCRRRVMRHMLGEGGQRRGEAAGLDLTMGVATFPHDGTDLSQLLRVAKHRADACRVSLLRKLARERQSLPELLDALFWATCSPEPETTSSIEWPQVIELPTADLIGLCVAALNEAVRGGGTQVVATQRAGMSIGAAVRAELGRESDEVRFDAVDVSTMNGCADLEVLSVIAEHGSYALLGRSENGIVRAVHSGDPLFADLLILRLSETAGMRLVD
jgi:DNA-binding response OmpR family regulator/GGDEF domain-containing protein